MGAAAMAATIAVGATAASRPAAASAERMGQPTESPHSAVLVPEAAAPRPDRPVASLHGLPPEVFAARIESVSAMLASR